MEVENSQNSEFESKLFEIPYDEYKKAIETESVKRKKNEILDLLKNYNKLHSEEEFREVEDFLYEACSKGDLDLIKTFLSETIENKSKTLKFKIDKINRTATLINIKKDIEEIIIPRTFEHESVEYLITSIGSTTNTILNKVNTIKFVEDSAVETIYSYALLYSRKFVFQQV